MGPRCIHFHYALRPVGQGLFVTGQLLNRQGRTFNWVFDSGGTKPRRFLIGEIGHYLSTLGSQGINLVVLSHFHEDHVFGLQRLLKSRRVETVVLPYLPLVERMLLAVTLRASGVFLHFLIDPASFVIRYGGPNARVVYIDGSGEGPAEDVSEPDSGGQGLDEEAVRAMDFVIPAGVRVEKSEEPFLSQQASQKVTRVSHRQPFSVRGIWEFVFLNYQAPASAYLALLHQQVAACIKHFRGNPRRRGAELLKKLKCIYAKHFHPQRIWANQISLVMYSGAIDERGVRIIPRVPSQWGLRRGFHDASSLQGSSRFFATGDISFRRVAPTVLGRHFGSRRWGRGGVTQVPHHGALGSWPVGAGPQPLDSVGVFCYGTRNPYGHPHPLVVKDWMLLSGGPAIRVTVRRGFLYFGRLL